MNGSLFISLISTPIKVPPFLFSVSEFLWMPITCIKFILLFNNIIGHPDDPGSVEISWSNSYILLFLLSIKKLISFTIPLAQAASFPLGCWTVKISVFLYILYPLSI